ncbi:unnamed protein product [Pleuronectes platessa]|uniref:Uncharacterized protein n=1 Tax=Pleuronectes platessa TaxID=8262 RepID=A0A9N7TVU7_PLEPL|nr:unnamed protein product [Pleuronectes platessa]
MCMFLLLHSEELEVTSVLRHFSTKTAGGFNTQTKAGFILTAWDLRKDYADGYVTTRGVTRYFRAQRQGVPSKPLQLIQTDAARQVFNPSSTTPPPLLRSLYWWIGTTLHPGHGLTSHPSPSTQSSLFAVLAPKWWNEFPIDIGTAEREAPLAPPVQKQVEELKFSQRIRLPGEVQNPFRHLFNQHTVSARREALSLKDPPVSICARSAMALAPRLKEELNLYLCVGSTEDGDS